MAKHKKRRRADNRSKPTPGRKAKAPRSLDVAPNATPELSAEFDATPLPFPVVGIGASAGGLDAFKRFFTAMPSNSGMAFVLIPHLDPTHESLMAELVGKYTEMPVVESNHGTRVEPNRVYVIPPSKYLTLSQGCLCLSEPKERRGFQAAVDVFFHSLAHDQREKAIGIVLSGTGSHGALGLKAIKANGGVTLVQAPETADYAQMPQSAIATGIVDCVMPVDAMPDVLVKYAKHSYVNAGDRPPVLATTSTDQLHQILAQLRVRTKYDFRCYRKRMLLRRVQRRMGLNHIDQLSDYVEFLREHVEEVQHLFKDLLIGVTGFLREPDAFRVLEDRVIQPLISAKVGEAPLRVWVPGCATGEEAYSLAMLLTEQLSVGQNICPLQIFATDIDKEALEAARQGIYPESISADISPERLQRFFLRADEHNYQVNKQLREAVVFAEQNLLTDAPFSRMDLVSCRNLLIYLEPDVQRKVISLFHFALNESGYLFLGASETVGRQIDLFEPVSKKWRIYRRLGPTRRDIVEFPVMPAEERRPLTPGPMTAQRRPASCAEIAQNHLLADYAPAAVMINRKYEIIYYFGPTSNYLDLPTGEPTQDLMMMAREGLRTKVRSCVHQAHRDNARAVVSDARVKRGGHYSVVRITARPIHEPKEATGLVLVTFEDQVDPISVPATPIDTVTDEPLVRQLEYELRVTKEDLQSTIEELESANEELKASNEEVMSMNEELQSANEELETSKEELQSLNEELTTVNNQLQDKVDDLERASNDMANLLSSTDIATLFLDSSLRIKRFTPRTAKLFNLIATDVGRPISDIARRFSDDDLLDQARNVVEDLTSREREVCTADGVWYLRRIAPYRTIDNKIEGVVVTFVDIDALKRAQDELRASEQRYRVLSESVLAGSDEGILTCTENGIVESINQSAQRIFGYEPSEIIGRNVSLLLSADDQDPSRAAATQAMLKDIGGVRHELIGMQKDGSSFPMEFSLSEMRFGDRLLVICIVRDISERHAAERRLHESRERYRSHVESSPDPIMIYRNDRVEYANPAASNLLGAHSAEQLYGRSIWEIVHPDYHEVVRQRIRDVLDSVTAAPFVEMKYVRLNGTTVDVEVTAIRLPGPGPPTIQRIARNISERKRLHDRLMQAQRLAAVGEAMTGLAHESGNALQRSKACLEMLRLRIEDNPESLDLLTQAQNAQEYLHSLYEEVRDYAAPLQLQRQLCDLSKIVQQAWSHVVAAYPARNAKLRQAIGQLDVLCQVDPRQSEQVFRNVMENSLHACKDPTQIDVRFSASELNGQPAIQVSVRDNGPGFAHESKQRVFEPFFTTKTSGTGLGLAIAKRIMDAHGGTIAIANRGGQGAELLIVFQRGGV